jgi:hypothetical protein
MYVLIKHASKGKKTQGHVHVRPKKTCMPQVTTSLVPTSAQSLFGDTMVCTLPQTLMPR